jgi:glycosyltransferase involved in cell wall biosynthesis
MKILFAGRLVDFKDPLTFIKAALLLNRDPTTEVHDFIVAGDGELLKACKQLAAKQANINLLGWIEQKKVTELMIQADVFCQLSPFENIWAASLISAMKHKKAIICTNVGYTNQFLKDGQNAILIPARDETRLAEAITALSENPELRGKLGTNAYTFVEEHLTVQKIATEIQNLLKKTVEQKQSETAENGEKRRIPQNES